MHWRLFYTRSHPFMLNMAITIIFALPITAISYKFAVTETCLQHHLQHYKAKKLLLKSGKSLYLLNLLYLCSYSTHANSSKVYRHVLNPLSHFWQTSHHTVFIVVNKHTGPVYFSINKEISSCGSQDQASHYFSTFKLF